MIRVLVHLRLGRQKTLSPRFQSRPAILTVSLAFVSIIGLVPLTAYAQVRIPDFMDVEWGSSPEAVETRWGTPDRVDDGAPYPSLTYTNGALGGANGIAISFQFDGGAGLIRGYYLFIGRENEARLAYADWRALMSDDYGEPSRECSRGQPCDPALPEPSILQAEWREILARAALEYHDLLEGRGWLLLSFEHVLYKRPNPLWLGPTASPSESSG